MESVMAGKPIWCGFWATMTLMTHLCRFFIERKDAREAKRNKHKAACLLLPFQASLTGPHSRRTILYTDEELDILDGYCRANDLSIAEVCLHILNSFSESIGDDFSLAEFTISLLRDGMLYQQPLSEEYATRLSSWGEYQVTIVKQVLARFCPSLPPPVKYIEITYKSG